MVEEEEGEVNETLLKVSSDSETEKKWSKEMAWESAEESSPSLRSAWGPSNFLFLYPSTVLIWSWGSGPSQSPWLFHGRGTTLIIKSGTVLFFMCFNHTNKALSIALAFSFTLTALQSFRSRVSEQPATLNYLLHSVADNEEATGKFCPASVANLNSYP